MHVIRDWCWLGTASDDGELAALAEAPQRAAFDPDVTRLLVRRYRAGTLALTPFARPSALAAHADDAGDQSFADACAATTSATQAVSRFA